ncbi:transposase [Desulfobacca acetoxidans]
MAQRSHLLYDFCKLVDFRFVKDTCRDFYVDWSRNAYVPVLMFKMVFLQFLYDLSDREVEEQITLTWPSNGFWV